MAGPAPATSVAPPPGGSRASGTGGSYFIGGSVCTCTGGRGCSITGGYVVRDPGLPGLAGRYVYADYCAGKLRSIRLAKGRGTGDRAVGLSVPQPTSFGEDGRGRVYVVSQTGAVYRLVAR